MIRLSRAMAGVAMHISSSEFLPSSLNSGPACITNVSPSSLKREDLAVVRPGRRGEGRGRRIDALLAVNLVARARVVAGEEAAVEQRVVVIAVDQRRRIVRTRRGLIPGDELVRWSHSRLRLISPLAPGLTAKTGRTWSPT